VRLAAPVEQYGFSRDPQNDSAADVVTRYPFDAAPCGDARPGDAVLVCCLEQFCYHGYILLNSVAPRVRFDCGRRMGDRLRVGLDRGIFHDRTVAKLAIDKSLNLVAESVLDPVEFALIVRLDAYP